MSMEDAGKADAASRTRKARPRSNPGPPADLNTMLVDMIRKGRIQLHSRDTESPEDAKHRRKQESLAFIVKEMVPYCLAALLMLASAVYSLYELLNSKSTPEDKQRAWTAFSMLLAGVVGFLYGKTTGK